MTTQTKSTKSIKESEVKRTWHQIDGKKKILGRTATQAARYLIGKHKTNYVDYLDMGDNVIITNVSEIVITGKKADQKMYARYSGYPGGLKKKTYSELIKRKPGEAMRLAVYGMLPKNKLRSTRIARLHIYQNESHPYQDKLLK